MGVNKRTTGGAKISIDEMWGIIETIEKKAKDATDDYLMRLTTLYLLTQFITDMKRCENYYEQSDVDELNNNLNNKDKLDSFIDSHKVKESNVNIYAWFANRYYKDKALLENICKSDVMNKIKKVIDVMNNLIKTSRFLDEMNSGKKDIDKNFVKAYNEAPIHETQTYTDLIENFLIKLIDDVATNKFSTNLPILKEYFIYDIINNKLTELKKYDDVYKNFLLIKIKNV